MSETIDWKNEYISKLKQIKLVEAGISVDKAEKYAAYISADNESEIEQEAQLLASDLSQNPTVYTDPGQPAIKQKVWNPFN